MVPPRHKVACGLVSVVARLRAARGLQSSPAMLVHRSLAGAWVALFLLLACAGSTSTGTQGGGSCRTTPPSIHRPSATTCPVHVSDAGADAAMTACTPHDACLVDADCGKGALCDCETPRCVAPFGTSGNACIAGDCRVDADCACGFCAADVWCGSLQSFHCTTTKDECSTDADCQDGSSNTQCRWSTDHWACAMGMGCPG